MKRRKIPRSRRLRSALPVIGLECTAAPRLAALCGTPALLTVAALIFASTPALPWRLALAAFVVASLCPVLRICLARGGEGAVRALLWDARGAWWLTDPDGVCVSARLTRASVFGPFIFLAFRDGDSRRRRALIDAAACDAPAARALLGRLRISGSGMRNA